MTTSDFSGIGTETKVFGALSFLLILIFLYIPIAGIGDLINILTMAGYGIRGQRTDPITLLFLYGREMLLALLYLGFFFRSCLVPSTLVKPAYFNLLIVIISMSIIISFIKYPPIVIIAGLRGLEYLPLLFIVPVIFKNTPAIIKSITKILCWFIIIEVLLCLLQTRFMPAFDGYTFFGSRTVGTFNNPNTIGIFFCFCFYWILFMSNTKHSVLWTIISGIGLLTTASRTAIIMFFMIIFFYLLTHYKMSVHGRGLFLCSSLLAATALFLSLNLLTGRERIKSTSIYKDPRVNILNDFIKKSNAPTFLFGRGIGVGSNTLPTLMSLVGDKTKGIRSISDSMIVAGLRQYGLIGCIVIEIFFFALSLSLGTSGILLFLMLNIAGFNNPWIEMYPINLMVFTFYGLLIGLKRTTLGPQRSNF